MKQWCAKPEQRYHQRNQAERQNNRLGGCSTGQPQQRKDDHQSNSGWQRGRPPCIGDLQRGSRDRQFVAGILEGGPSDQQQKGKRGAGRETVQQSARRPGQHADTRRHAHMFVAVERNYRAEHCQPQEQCRGQLIRPNQRPVEDVAGDHAAKQDCNFGNDQTRRRNLDCRADRGLDRSSHRSRRDRTVMRWLESWRPGIGGHASLPTDFSRRLHASSPYLLFHSV